MQASITSCMHTQCKQGFGLLDQQGPTLLVGQPLSNQHSTQHNTAWPSTQHTAQGQHTDPEDKQSTTKQHQCHAQDLPAFLTRLLTQRLVSRIPEGVAQHQKQRDMHCMQHSPRANSCLPPAVFSHTYSSVLSHTHTLATHMTSIMVRLGYHEAATMLAHVGSCLLFNPQVWQYSQQHDRCQALH